MVGNSEIDSGEVERGSWEEREVNMIEMQYVYVPIPRDECNHYVSQTY